ncbi:hypothetical protein [Actinomadura madurae]|uniref:hypothetical protein n=1 Tax=Actinomadura madurae TaxID=1993 RepID=UPI0020D239BE|nr:hypothetical protein [Actinomadura madurae]MCP9977651.1 hypothetical protein [Actinomadura madurae]MCQ0013835.1 hypothetical protein [Actinomadura madurae]
MPTATKATVEPTDRSICPVVITNVMATATISVIATWVARLEMLSKLRKLSAPMPKPANSRTVTAAMARVALLARSHQPGVSASTVGAVAAGALMLRPPPLRCRSRTG